MDVICVLEGVVSKGQTVVALSVRSKREIFLNFELSTKEGKARGEGLGSCIFARNCKNNGGC